jgi:DNA (cytosine-5)-methyltransferase 1
LEKIKLKIENKKTNELKSFRQAIMNLPHLKPGEGANVACNISNSIGVEGRFEGNSLVFNHFSRSHNKRDLTIYRLLAEGEDYGKFSERNDDTSLLPYASDSFKTKFRKIDGNQPSPAIISHLSRDANSYIHPDDNRGITVREGARIQSFPDDFIFLGNGFRQFVLLGNAVPPDLSEIIGKAIVEVIKEGFV